jgi:Plasmid pRiA4b ORF-3-like protein
MSAATIARLKITLDDVKPSVVRRIEVPFDIRLDRLHLTIQAAMGWTNSHLYEIRAGDVGWSTPYPDQDWAGDFLDARKAELGDMLKDVGTKTLKYLSVLPRWHCWRLGRHTRFTSPNQWIKR